MSQDELEEALFGHHSGASKGSHLASSGHAKEGKRMHDKQFGQQKTGGKFHSDKGGPKLQQPLASKDMRRVRGE